MIPDVVADRYASSAMVAVWSPEAKVVRERELWLAVLTAQRDLGLAVPAGAVEDYEAVVGKVDLDSIRARELVTRHDVKARIEEFCALAGHELIHVGMTSRDLTENVEQLQIRLALEVVRDKCVAALRRLADRAVDAAELTVAGRTHNVPAQATTFGKRLASSGEELLVAFERLEDLLARYPLRGLKGPVGTQQDQLDLFDGDAATVAELERRVAAHLGFASVMGSVGQVYPRSLDYEVATALAQLTSGPANLAKTLRLMAGHGLATEGFQAGQVGSSAMPHKRNMRSSERIGGLSVVVRGYADMLAGLVGDQWNEGDVSDSVVRRVAIPGAFLATDGLFETFLTVLDEMAPIPEAIGAELDANAADLASTKRLLSHVRDGMGREEAHAAATEGAAASPDVGLAAAQVRAFAAKVEPLVAQYPEAATYQPESIL